MKSGDEGAFVSESLMLYDNIRAISHTGQAQLETEMIKAAIIYLTK